MRSISPGNDERNIDAFTSVDDYPEFLGVPEVCRVLRKSKNTVYAAIKSGLIPSRRVGNTQRLHHAVLHGALKFAIREGLVHRNVASLAARPPRKGVRPNGSWNAEEARRVIDAASGMREQTSAWLALALDTGARKAEIQGLRWKDVDLTGGTVRIEGQLLKDEQGKPMWGPTKTGNVRSIDLSAQTVALLQKQKAAQAELKMRNRLHYRDHGLVFAQTWENPRVRNTKLGDPLSGKSLEGMLSRLIDAAKVRRITIHGLRHTAATLLLVAGVQPHVVQRRLGHSSIVTTLDIYASVLPSQQQDAAAKLAALLHG